MEVNPAESGTFTSVITYLPVKKWGDVLAFFRMSKKVEKQLKQTEGIVRYGLKADFIHKKFWTYSVWRSEDAIQPFIHAEPHATAIRKFADWSAEGAAFAQWNNNDGKINWKEGDRQLLTPTFYYQK